MSKETGVGTSERVVSRTGVVAGICVVLSLIPLLALLYKECRYGLYFPYWDAWQFSLFLQKALTEGVGFGDFWAQHNEHRLVFPRLVMYGLARLSGWNVAWELGASVVLATGTFLLLVRLAFRGLAATAPRWIVVPVFSFLVYSWVQMENWVWGWQLQVFLSTCAVVTAVELLSGAALTPVRFALAVGAALVASFSFANGQISWIALAPLVFFAPTLQRQPRIIYSLLWVAAGILVVQLYLIDYTKPSVSPSIGAVFHAPLQFLGYFVVYLGAPITGIFARPAWHGVPMPIGPAHFIAGTIGGVALPVLLWRLYRQEPKRYGELLPWVGLALYVLGSAALTSAGRAGEGLGQAMTSRYTTITTLYWCALAALLALYLQRNPLTAFACPHRRKLYGSLAALAFVVLLGLSHHNERAWEQNAHWKRMGWNALRAGHIAPLYLSDLWDPPAELQDRFLPILREWHWAGFGGEPYRPVELVDAYVDDAEQFIEMQFYGQAKTYLETALFLDETNERAQRDYQQLRALVEGRSK